MRRIIIINLLSFFLFISTSQIYSAEINGLRYYSAFDKTRIVILTNKLEPYKIQYDMVKHISLTLIKTDLKYLKKEFNINDGLIKSANLNKTDNNSVELKLILSRPCFFNVFTLEAPFRVVIDVMAFENVVKLSDMIKPEVVQISDDGNEICENNELFTETVSTNITEKKYTSIFANSPQSMARNTIDVFAKNTSLGKIIYWSWSAKYIIVQFLFTLTTLIILVYISLKMKKFFKFAQIMKRNSIHIGELNLRNSQNHNKNGLL